MDFRSIMMRIKLKERKNQNFVESMVPDDVNPNTFLTLKPFQSQVQSFPLRRWYLEIIGNTQKSITGNFNCNWNHSRRICMHFMIFIYPDIIMIVNLSISLPRLIWPWMYKKPYRPLSGGVTSSRQRESTPIDLLPVCSAGSMLHWGEIMTLFSLKLSKLL